MDLDNFKLWVRNYKWMEFVLACVFTVFIATVSYNYELEWLGPFAAIGLIVIGYISKDKIIGGIMGGVGALPIAFAMHFQIMGPIEFISSNNIYFIILMYVIVFVMGFIVGLIGSIVYSSRAKRISEIKFVGKNSTKNKKKNKK